MTKLVLRPRNKVKGNLRERIISPVPSGKRRSHISHGLIFRGHVTTKERNPPHNVVFPSQFARLLIEYQEHPESKSLAPDGSPCGPHTSGLLQRAHIIAGKFRYVGKESDRKWEEGDDISVLEFEATEYGRPRRVVASEEVKSDITRIGINLCARESGFDRKNFIRKLVRGLQVKRNSYEAFVKWLQSYKSQHAVQ